MSWMALALVVVFGTSPSDPWWVQLAAYGGLVGAIVNWMQLRAQWGLIDREIKGQLAADLTKLEVEMEARLKAETRAQVARLRQSYVNALPFHATLLRDHMSSVGEKLSRDESRQQMKNWFEDIKKYGNRSMATETCSPAVTQRLRRWSFPPGCTIR
ncbi:MAG TPA: hypothetical protein VEX68_07250 [Bryobacteraceae bacterium]|nr:hypothetical protein [Bryobacteraceae bacterium]